MSHLGDAIVGQKIKKVQAKNSWNQINQKNFFVKLHFWPFLKLQKMEFGQNKNSWDWLIWFHEFFWPRFFVIFWPTVLIPVNIHVPIILLDWHLKIFRGWIWMTLKSGVGFCIFMIILINAFLDWIYSILFYFFSGKQHRPNSPAS